MPDSDRSRYPSISSYAFLSDGHAVALVSRQGSVDWCCLPRIDAGSSFGRILDWDRGGSCEVRPDGVQHSERSYAGDSLVLVTRFEVDGGECTVTDCLPVNDEAPRRPHRQLLRVVDGGRGQVAGSVVVAPRFDYGGVVPWLRRVDRRIVSAIGGDDSLLIAADVDLEIDTDDGSVTARWEVAPGERVRLAITWFAPEDLDAEAPVVQSAGELDRRLAATRSWWEGWADSIDGEVRDPDVRRSAMVLKGLVNLKTGAVAAAATTSLPEAVGEERNWDYRLSWIRDSQFTTRALADIGCDEEADGFRRFIERSAAGDAESLRVAYGIAGARRVAEHQLRELDGYRGSRPVRVGNDAAGQRQLGVYGYLLDLAWRWHRRGRSPDDDYWRFLVGLVDAAADRWQLPDAGIWEVRGDLQHFVHSKVMCWSALDRGIQLADECLRTAPVRRWRAARDAIRCAVDEDGYDDRQGTFVRRFGGHDVDASLLLLPAFGFLAYDDERMVRTTDAVREQLMEGGMLRRYRADDGLAGEEGAFLACNFWLVECLAHQGRLDEAQAVHHRTMAAANDLGLFSEEVDPRTGEALGNCPQALTHLSHIAAAVALRRPNAG